MIRVGRALRLAGAGGLALALFLPWSHQYDAGFLARVGAANPVLSGVPRSPDAWQLYTFADVLLALLAAALALSSVVALRLPRGRVAWLAGLAIAAAFAVHALAVPPTSGVNVFDAARGDYVSPGASAGPGEWVALAGLILAAGGLLVPRPPSA